MNKGKQRMIYKSKGERLKIWPVKRRKTGQGIIDSSIFDTHLRPLTNSCDNRLNESSFYQVGACLQAEFCHEDWIPHISVGYEINKPSLVMRVGFLIS
jgi:hypothetical protein